MHAHARQAQYFRDASRLDDYLALNPFLPDVNNEHKAKNTQYAANLVRGGAG